MCSGQGVQYTRKEANPGGAGVAYPLVTVCTSGASYTPLPCSPKASIYSDAGLAAPLVNPFRGDGFGNIEFYAAAGTYVVSVTDPYSPGYSFKVVLSNPPGDTTYLRLDAANSPVTGAVAFSNGLTSNGQTNTRDIVPSVAASYVVGSQPLPYTNLCLGTLANHTICQTTAPTANRNVIWADASGTPSLAAVEYCGATSGASQPCAKTVQTLPYVVWGDVTLNTATSQSISTLPFTDGLFSCTGSDLTTPTGIVSFNTYVSASVTIQESGGTNVDHLRYICVGR